MPRPRFLVIDQDILPDWRPLPLVADVSVLQVPDSLYRFRRPGVAMEAYMDAALTIARANAGRFDYVLAECAGAFLWHCLFRLVGDRTPFVIVPRFNCVHAADAYAGFLSSHFFEPRDVVFCGSHSACRAFELLGLRCSPLFVPGIDLNQFRPLRTNHAKTRESLGAAAARRDLLLYVGRLTDDKNVLELLRAVQLVREVRDVELILCYRFPREEYLSKCREFADAMGGVRFVKDPDPQTIIHWYNSADLFVSAAVSIFETFGRAPVEAMACGTPPVVPAYNGFRETVSAETGFLVPTTVCGIRKEPDIDRTADVILGALEDRLGLQRKAYAGPPHTMRFERNRTVRSMLADLEHGPPRRSGSHRLGQRLSLEGYPPEVAGLWAPLAGESVRDLAVDFLRTGRIPIEPSDASVRDFYVSWFSHY